MKALIALLVAANLLFLGWSTGAFDGLIADRSWRPDGDREPERLRRQVRPESIRVLPAGAAGTGADTASGEAASGVAATSGAANPGGSEAAAVASGPASGVEASAASGPASSVAAAATACLEAGPFTSPAELENARSAASVVAPGAELEAVPAETPGRWIVYLGRYPSELARQRRREELGRRGVVAEAVDTPVSLAPGLVLGRYARRDAADEALAGFIAAQGLRAARVVELAATTSSTGNGTMLRVARATPTVAARLAAADGGALGGRRFMPCAIQR